MTNPNDETKKPNINAENNSNVVGSFNIGGDLSGNIHVGNTNIYSTPEDDLPLSSDEIENGLTRFAQFIPERAPVLQDSFSSIAKKLRATLGADQNSLSPALKSQREDGVDRMKLMCMEVTDISFRAICLEQNPPLYDSRPPFLGLFAFRPEDREFFFGRDTLVQKLGARIKAHPFLAVLGASGSGKSSLVMAGLIPALEAQMSYLTPSSAPLSQLLTAKESVSAKTVFVIDQFEELFTHPHDAAERADFIHALLELIKTNRVVVTMRADFWGEVAIYSDLKQAMQEHQELIAPMTVDELHSAMEKQAAVVGLRFDPTLSESILAEVKGEPGAMPLLQHALWELWNRRHGLWIKAEEYQAFGGVKQAIASTAEEVYASCSDFERARVRDIFLRLTRLDESSEGRDTRRRVLIEELIPVNSDSSVTINLLNKLADARLIVKTDKDVEVAHEALIRHWSRLTEWLNEDRDNLRLREGVSESAREWENSKRDDSLLNHRSGRLELALAMSKLPRYPLNPNERVYLDSCVDLSEKEKAIVARRRKITYTSIFGVLALVMAILTGWSISSTESTNAMATQVSVANTAQVNAEIEKQNAEDQAHIALTRQLAAQAQSLFATGYSKQIPAVLLAIQSLRLNPSIEAAQILQTNSLPHQVASITYDNTLNTIAFSFDGVYMLSGGCDKADSSDHCTQGSVRVMEVATGKEIAHMTSDATVNSASFSPDGKYVISGGGTTARVWEVATGKEIAHMTHDGEVSSVAFSPNSKYVVSGGCDQSDTICIQGSAHVWEATTGKEISSILHSRGIGLFLAFNSNGKYVVSYVGYTASVWEAATGKEIASMTHDNWVVSVAFSPDDRYVVSGSVDGTARVWEVATGKEIIRKTYGDVVSSVAFSPDGKYVALANFTFVPVWEVTTGKDVADMRHDGRATSVAFSPDGKYVVSGSTDGTARMWEVATGKETARITHDSYVVSVTFSPDGKYVVSRDGTTAIVWETSIRNEIARMTHDSYASSFAFSPDGKYVVSGSGDGTTRVWETRTGKEIFRISHDGAVAFSADSKYVVSISGNAAHVWMTSTGIEVAHMTYEGNVSSVAFSPDSKYTVLGSFDKTARVWEAATGQEVARVIHDNPVESVAFSPDGKHVVSTSVDDTIRVWEATTGKELARMTGSSVNSIAFSPDGKHVVSTSDDNTIRIWEINTGKETTRIAYEGATFVAFSSNGKYLALRGCDTYGNANCTQGFASVWDVGTGKEISHMTHDGEVWSVAFSPDGQYLVSGSSDNTARVWEISTGKEISRMTQDGWVWSVAFSPDGKYVVSGGCDKQDGIFCAHAGSARVWEAATGNEIARKTLDSSVYSVAFSPDGKYVISSSGDYTVRVWIYRPEDLTAEACSRVARNLTRAEWKQYIGDALPYQAVCPNLAIEAESTPTP